MMAMARKREKESKRGEKKKRGKQTTGAKEKAKGLSSAKKRVSVPLFCFFRLSFGLSQKMMKMEGETQTIDL